MATKRRHRRSTENSDIKPSRPWEELPVLLQRGVIIAQDAADHSVEYYMMPAVDSLSHSPSTSDLSKAAVAVPASQGPSPDKKSKASTVHHILVHNKPLGKGGFGVVYRALQTDQHNKVSKEICLKHAREGSYDALLKENDIFNHLHDHPHLSIINRLFLCKQTACDTFLGLEFFDGFNLHHIINLHIFKKKNIKLRHLLAILKEQTEAIQHLQNYGIFHCDIKPENILYNMSKKSSKLIDFGLAIQVYGVNETLKSQGGTTEYMAPESLVDGNSDIGTDLYGLGATLCHLITLKTPWHFLDSVKSAKVKPTESVADQQKIKMKERNDIKSAIRDEIKRFRRDDFHDSKDALMAIQLYLHKNDQCISGLRKIVADMLNYKPNLRPLCADILHCLEDIRTEHLVDRSTKNLSVSTVRVPAVRAPNPNVSAVIQNNSQLPSACSSSLQLPAVINFCDSAAGTTHSTHPAAKVSDEMPFKVPNRNPVNDSLVPQSTAARGKRTHVLLRQPSDEEGSVVMGNQNGAPYPTDEMGSLNLRENVEEATSLTGEVMFGEHDFPDHDEAVSSDITDIHDHPDLNAFADYDPFYADYCADPATRLKMDYSPDPQSDTDNLQSRRGEEVVDDDDESFL